MKYKIACIYLLIGINNVFGLPTYETYKEEKSATKGKIKQKDSIQKHTFKEEFDKNNHPLFSNSKQKIDLHYATTLGLSNTQTLIFNGIKVRYEYPFKYNKMEMKTFSNMAFGNTLITMQSKQNSIFFYGANAGLNASIPLSIQNVNSYAVFGVKLGFGLLSKESTSTIMSGYAGIDFLYNQYVFRPFVSLSCIIPSSSLYNVNISGIGDIGLKTFYIADSMLVFASLSVSSVFSSNDANVFILLPQATPLYLNANTMRVDFNGGIRYFTTKYLNIYAMLSVDYALNYYALNAGGQVGISYLFGLK